jgi:hypothetical protein
MYAVLRSTSWSRFFHHDFIVASGILKNWEASKKVGGRKKATSIRGSRDTVIQKKQKNFHTFLMLVRPFYPCNWFKRKSLSLMERLWLWSWPFPLGIGWDRQGLSEGEVFMRIRRQGRLDTICLMIG